MSTLLEDLYRKNSKPAILFWTLLAIMVVLIQFAIFITYRG